MSENTRYVIDSITPVGQGGFGKVRRGTDSVLGRQVAVKSLDPAYAAANEEDKERFRREARILAKLSHPNIPAIYDVSFDGTFEIIFQFVDGKTLREILVQDGPVKLAECRIWFDQIASALGHAHDNGIIHRDIKPENIIVTPDRKHCYLVDFGIALSKADLARLTGSDNWIGTPGYMSPEQQNGDELDASDDLYVLGCVLYEALSGHQIEQGKYEPLNSLNELIPPAVDDLIKKCIEKKARRCQKATEFRNRFHAAFARHRVLSELLAAGQLHEIVDAIAEMTPTQFMDLKAGQRLLILQKCQDLVNSSDRRLTLAREEFLQILTSLGILLPESEYKRIVNPAFNFGFGLASEADGSFRGSRIIRESLIDASAKAAVPNHHEIVDAALLWISQSNLQNEKSWVYHSLRQIIAALMANPECDDTDAEKLAGVLASVNELQVQRVQQPSEPDFELDRFDFNADEFDR